MARAHCVCLSGDRRRFRYRRLAPDLRVRWSSARGPSIRYSRCSGRDFRRRTKRVERSSRCHIIRETKSRRVAHDVNAMGPRRCRDTNGWKKLNYRRTVEFRRSLRRSHRRWSILGERENRPSVYV